MFSTLMKRNENIMIVLKILEKGHVLLLEMKIDNKKNGETD